VHVILICIWQAHKVHIFRFPWVDFIYRFDCSCIFIFSVEVRTNMGWKSRQTDIDLGWNQRGTPVFTRWKILKMLIFEGVVYLCTVLKKEIHDIFWQDWKFHNQVVLCSLQNILVHFFFFYRVYIQDLFTQKFIKEK
jgi:hypothetical protein